MTKLLGELTEPVHMDKSGRLLIPAAIRERMGWQPGQELILYVEQPGTIIIRTPDQALDEVQKFCLTLKPGQSVVESLIADRRAEAAADGF